MRHGKKFNHLSRTDSHRRALLSSLATSLIVHKRINTTVAKAKALRVYVEPLLTKSKTDSTHSRRTVFSYLQDKNSVNILFRDVAGKIAEREGGYTRIIKTGTRMGDNAEMCFIELVDYNLVYTAKTEVVKAKSTRRGRSTGSAAITGKVGTVKEVAQSDAQTPTSTTQVDLAAHGSDLSPASLVKPATGAPAKPVTGASETPATGASATPESSASVTTVTDASVTPATGSTALDEGPVKAEGKDHDSDPGHPVE